MLTCREVSAQASLLVDGELGVRGRIAVRLHLMMCANCRRFIRQFKTFVSSMARRNQPDVESVSPEFVGRVMRQIDGARESSGS